MNRVACVTLCIDFLTMKDVCNVEGWYFYLNRYTAMLKVSIHMACVYNATKLLSVFYI